MSALLSVRDLTVSFETDYGTMLAVDGVHYDLERGEVIGIVGESGSGKSVAAQSILGLVPSPPSHIEKGEILFDGRDLLRAAPEELRSVRGNDISVIFQEPMTSLNPLLTIGAQVMEPLLLHGKADKKEARERAKHLLSMVGFPNPERILNEYPHRLSGGMRQRVMIGMALICDPKILIADEPTTALDVTIQAQIFELLAALKKETDMAVILITHDLGVVADYAHKVMVMYAGRTMESAPARDIFENPAHPYTQGLLACIPQIDRTVDRLPAIEGVVPNAYDMPAGCAFHPRCALADELCVTVRPALEEVSAGHLAACHHKGRGYVRRM